MNPNPQRRQPPDWEAVLDRELKRLPDRPAPDTLIPRVLAVVEGRTRRPWYRQPWRSWPPPAQILSVVVTSIVLGLLTWLSLHAGGSQWIEAGAHRADAWLAPLAPLLSVLSGLANAAALVVRSVSPWVWAGAAGFCVLMYLSCMGLGTIVWQVADSRRKHEPVS
jgi:hypothetical protein